MHHRRGNAISAGALSNFTGHVQVWRVSGSDQIITQCTDLRAVVFNFRNVKVSYNKEMRFVR